MHWKIVASLVSRIRSPAAVWKAKHKIPIYSEMYWVADNHLLHAIIKPLMLQNGQSSYNNRQTHRQARSPDECVSRTNVASIGGGL